MSLSNETVKTQDRFKLIGWSLLASVLLNLFMVGTFLGVVPHAKHHPFMPMALAAPHSDYMVEWMARMLEPHDADLFREAYKTHAPALKQAHDHVREAMDGIATAFQQPQPDPGALQAALQKLATARNEVHETTGVILKTAYAKVSPEGRQKLANLDPHRLPPQ